MKKSLVAIFFAGVLVLLGLAGAQSAKLGFYKGIYKMTAEKIEEKKEIDKSQCG